MTSEPPAPKRRQVSLDCFFNVQGLQPQPEPKQAETASSATIQQCEVVDNELNFDIGTVNFAISLTDDVKKKMLTERFIPPNG